MAKQQVSSIDNSKNATYQVNGLAYASNIATVNKRDEAGNLIYQEGESNPALIIEPVTENLVTASVIKVVNTQFSYFKFPARTTIEAEEDFDLGIDPNDFIVNLEELQQDVFPTQYRPTLDQVIPKSTTFQTLEFSTVVSGQAQTQTNSFSVTQKVLDEVTAQIRVTGLLKTFYSANLDTELSFAVMEYDAAGGLVGRVSPVITPSEGVKFDNNGNITGEGDYVSNFDFTIIKSGLTLGHSYRVAGQTDRNTDKRNHTLYALDSYISYTAE